MPHLASLVFDRPLLITRARLTEILKVVLPRIEGQPAVMDDYEEWGYAEPRVSPEGIAVIPVVGTLVQRSFGIDAMSGVTSYEWIRCEVEKALDNPAAQAILLDIDSGGGEVSGCFDLVDFIAEAGTMKPIWAVANEAAYSAAYAIASATSRIYLPRTGGVGSIGVIAIHLDESGFDQKMGIKFTEIIAGARKADGSPFRPLSDRAESDIQAEVDRVYEIFLAIVAKGRNISIDAVRATEAGTFHGADALPMLADNIGTFREAEQDLLGALNTTYSPGGVMTGPKVEKPEAPAAIEKPPAPVLDAAIGTKPESEVIDLDAHRTKADLDARQYATDVIDLCTLAGFQQMSAGFIKERASIEKVRSTLLEVKAAKTDAVRISGVTGTADSEAALKANNYGWDRAFAKYAAQKK